MQVARLGLAAPWTSLPVPRLGSTQASLEVLSTRMIRAPLSSSMAAITAVGTGTSPAPKVEAALTPFRADPPPALEDLAVVPPTASQARPAPAPVPAPILTLVRQRRRPGLRGVLVVAADPGAVAIARDRILVPTTVPPVNRLVAALASRLAVVRLWPSISVCRRC